MGLHWQFLVVLCHIVLVVKGEAEADADAEAQQYGGPGYGNRQAYPTSDMSNVNMGPYGTLNNIQPSGNIRPVPVNYNAPPMMQPPIMQPPIMQPPIMQPPVSSSGCGGNMGCGSKPVSSEPYQTYTYPEQPQTYSYPEQVQPQTYSYPEQVQPQENSVPGIDHQNLNKINMLSEMTQTWEQPMDMATTVQQQPYMNQQMMPYTKSYTPISGTNCMQKCSVRPNYQTRPSCRPVCNRRPLCRASNPTPVPQVDYSIQGNTMYCNPQPSRCILNTCGWGGWGYNQGNQGWSNGGSGYNPGGDSWSNGGSGYNPGGDSWTNGGSGYNPGGDVIYGGSGYNPGGDVIYGGNEGFNPGYTSQQPMYRPSFVQPSSGCNSGGCGSMPQPMAMTRPAPCGSGGCSNPPVYQAGNAVTLPASVSRGQPAAPGVPAAPGMPPAEVDVADSYSSKS